MSGLWPAAISVLKEADCSSYGAPEQLPFTDEGRALLQIVHAVAPDAGWRSTPPTTVEAVFANGILHWQRLRKKSSTTMSAIRTSRSSRTV